MAMHQTTVHDLYRDLIDIRVHDLSVEIDARHGAFRTRQQLIWLGEASAAARLRSVALATVAATNAAREEHGLAVDLLRIADSIAVGHDHHDQAAASFQMCLAQSRNEIDRELAAALTAGAAALLTIGPPLLRGVTRGDGTRLRLADRLADAAALHASAADRRGDGPTPATRATA